MRVLAAVAALSLVAACQAPSPGATDAESAQVEAGAVDAIAARWDAYATGNVSKEVWLSFWTEDAQILEPGFSLTGPELPAFGDSFFDGGGQVFSFEMGDGEIWVHGDVAYQLGRYDEEFQFPGQDRARAQNYFFARWEKQQDGTWRISRFMAGPRDAPPTD